MLDLDGTLVDSAPELAAALDRALAPLGRRTLALDEVRGMIGDGIPALTHRALAATGSILGGAAFETVLATVRRTYDDLPLSPFYAGVPETLARLRAEGCTLGVCTNKPEAPARRLLAEHGFDRWIAAVAGGDTFAVKKPDPGHIAGLLRLMEADRRGAVVIGDSANDAHAARAAGLPFVAASYGYCKGPVTALGADAMIESFSELPDVLARIAGMRTG